MLIWLHKVRFPQKMDTFISGSLETSVFIVRVWNEPREIQNAPPQWRGMIEFLPTRERRYFQNLSEMSRFLTEKSGFIDGGESHGIHPALMDDQAK